MAIAIRAQCVRLMATAMESEGCGRRARLRNGPDGERARRLEEQDGMGIPHCNGGDREPCRWGQGERGAVSGAEGTMFQVGRIGHGRIGDGGAVNAELDQFAAACTANFRPPSTLRYRPGMGNRRRERSKQDRKTCNPCRKAACHRVHSHGEIISAYLPTLKLAATFSMPGEYRLHGHRPGPVGRLRQSLTPVETPSKSCLDRQA